MELRNRVVQLPHGVYFAEVDAPLASRRHVEYYRRRAAGGVALVVMESSVVSADGRGRNPLTLACDPRAVDGYRAISEAVHVEGARMAGQITHFGSQSISALTREPLVAPSSVADPLVREQPRAMTDADLGRVRHDFVTSALNFVAAGFDAVEVKLAHDGLLRQFMSPLTNERRDVYGGIAENRLRYPLEVLRAVRAAIGSAVALGVRLVVDEHVDGGYGLDEGLMFASLVGQSGVVDYISSDVGISSSIHWVIPPMGVVEGYAEDAFAGITRASGLPVIACGQISDPAYAERVLAEGKAAAVGMARQLLADPDWAVRALSGSPERIRPCTRCNQLCVRNSIAFVATGCTVNPGAGHEGEGAADLRSQPVRLTVVGGGPAGLEAARVAAERGHAVILMEARDCLGGRLDLAASCGGRTGWRPYLDWLQREVARLGVTVRRGHRAVADDVLSSRPDAVIVATGSLDGEPPVGRASLASIDEFLKGSNTCGRTVLADLGAAGMELWSAAIEAARRGAPEITIVTPLAAVGADVDGPTYLHLREKMAELGVRVLTEHTVVAAGDGWLTARQLYTRRETSVRADVLVGNWPRRSEEDLMAGLTGRVPVSAIGDALVPRDVSAAIREAWEVASRL